MFPRFTKVLLLLLLLQTSPAQAGWLSDHLKSASDAVFENDEGMNADTLLEEASVTIDAATGALKEASSRAEELLLQKKAEAQEVVSQLSEFAASARKPPSDEVKKMLSEDGFSHEDPESSCASNGRFAVRCIVWNFAVILDMGNHSSTDAVGLRASVKTPGIPALEMALLDAETMVPVPGFAADVKSPSDPSTSLAKLGIFLRFRVANGTDGGFDVNIGATACASVGSDSLGGCFPTEPVVSITNGQIVVATKIATMISLAAPYMTGPGAGFAIESLVSSILVDLMAPGVFTRERGSLALGKIPEAMGETAGNMLNGLWGKLVGLDGGSNGAIDVEEFQKIAPDLSEPVSSTELQQE